MASGEHRSYNPNNWEIITVIVMIATESRNSFDELTES